MQPLIEIQAEREEFVSRIIRYLDPDFDPGRNSSPHRENMEGLITLFLLLGGVIVCFVLMLVHLRG